MEQSHSWTLTGSQLVKKFPVFYGTQRFITEFTRTRHLSLSRPLTVYIVLIGYNYAFKALWSSVRVVRTTDMAVVRILWGIYEKNWSVCGIQMHGVVRLHREIL